MPNCGPKMFSRAERGRWRSVRFPSAPEPDEQMDRVIAWWTERLREGCQLSNLPLFKEGHDYTGRAPWKIKVAGVALHRDFCIHSPTALSYIQFLNRFRELTGHRIDRSSKERKIVADTTKKVHRHHVGMIRFAELAHEHEEFYRA